MNAADPKFAGRAGANGAPPHIPVAISARHVHLRPTSITQLFGPDHPLHAHAQLKQPGQFSTEETVSLIGPKGRIDHVRVVGPPRSEDQVEISRSDGHALGIEAPVRESGRLAATPGMRIEGPAGSITLDHGVICALRHIHADPESAAALGLRDQQRVDVAVESGDRRLIFGDVIVRVSDRYRLELHLDTDEANAAGLQPGAEGLLLAPTRGTASLIGPTQAR